MQILNELLDSLIIGAPQVFEEVQVIPLFSKQPEAAATFLQLDEALKQGLITLRQDGWKKVLMGVTTIDEVARVTAADLA